MQWKAYVLNMVTTSVPYSKVLQAIMALNLRILPKSRPGALVFTSPILIHRGRGLVNERHNGLLRQYIPKGISIEKYSAEDVLWFADELNSLPRKRLGYRTPEELFEAFLDKIYAA